MASSNVIIQHDKNDSVSENVLFSSRNECVYTSCYCEENVWHLCSAVREKQPDELVRCYSVFISNQEQSIPLWEQTLSEREDGLVIWDYHVIFVHQGSDGSCVYDLDTRLDFPCSFKYYMEQGIKSCTSLKQQYQRQFRVVPAAEFLSTFASDRSHMLDEDGKWLKPPPAYPCLQTTAATNNIKEFKSMDPEVGVGEVMVFGQFYDKFLN